MIDVLLSGNILPKIGAVTGLLITIISWFMKSKEKTFKPFTVNDVGYLAGIFIALCSASYFS